MRHRGGWGDVRALVRPGLVLVTLLAVGGSMAAGDSDRWTPPPISKAATEDALALGDDVRFVVAVRHSPELPPVSVWYEVEMRDVFDPAFRIDEVSVIPSSGQVAVVDNTVVVTMASLELAAMFSTYVDCTLVGPVEPGQVITNGASFRYEAPPGTPHGPVEVENPVSIRVLDRVLLPIVLRTGS